MSDFKHYPFVLNIFVHTKSDFRLIRRIRRNCGIITENQKQNDENAKLVTACFDIVNLFVWVIKALVSIQVVYIHYIFKTNNLLYTYLLYTVYTIYITFIYVR